MAKLVPGSPSKFRHAWVFCKARDDAGEWRKLYKGHLQDELICAGGSKLLDGRNRKSLRLTHGSQRLLMPEEAVRWDNSPRKDDVPPAWEDSSDEYEEEHNTLNHGLGLCARPHLRATSRLTSSTCPWSGDKFWEGARDGASQGRGWFSTDPSSRTMIEPRVRCAKCQSRRNDDRSVLSRCVASICVHGARVRTRRKRQQNRSCRGGGRKPQHVERAT